MYPTISKTRHINNHNTFPSSIIIIILITILTTIVSLLIAPTYGQYVEAFPFSDVTVTQPSVNSPQISFRGIIANTHRLDQMRQWSVDLSYYNPGRGFNVDFFSGGRVIMYDLPDVLYQSKGSEEFQFTLDPIYGNLYASVKMRAWDGFTPSTTSSHTNNDVNTDTTNNNNINNNHIDHSIDVTNINNTSFQSTSPDQPSKDPNDGPNYVMFIVELDVTSKWFAYAQDHPFGVLASLEVFISSSIPDEQSQFLHFDQSNRSDNLKRTYSSGLLTAVPVSYYPLMEPIIAIPTTTTISPTSSTQSNTSISKTTTSPQTITSTSTSTPFAILSQQTIIHQLNHLIPLPPPPSASAFPTYHQVNFVRLPPTEKLISSHYYNTLPVYKPTLSFSTLSRWSIDIPWGKSLGGGNDDDHQLGFERPDYIEIIPFGPVGFTANVTQVINNEKQTENDHPQTRSNVQMPHQNETKHHQSFSSLSSSDPHIDPVTVKCYLNGYPVDTTLMVIYQSFEKSIWSEEPKESAIPFIKVSLSDDIWPHLFYISPHINDGYINDKFIERKEGNTDFAKDDSPLNRFGFFTLDCRDKIIMTSPVIQNLSKWNDIAPHGLTVNLVKQSLKHSMRYDIIPIDRGNGNDDDNNHIKSSQHNNTDNNNSDDITTSIRTEFPIPDYIPQVLGLDQSTPTLFDIPYPAPPLFNMSTPSTITTTTTTDPTSHIPSFVIPMAPPIITTMTDLIGYNQNYIPVRIAFSVLLDMNYFTNPPAIISKAIPPSLQLSLISSDYYQILTNQTIYITYQRVGITKNGVNNNENFFYTTTQWKEGGNEQSSNLFSLPSFPSQSFSSNSFPFNNNIHQYYTMTILIEVGLPNLFLKRYDNVLCSNQIKLQFFSSTSSTTTTTTSTIPFSFYQHIPIERWLLNVFNRNWLKRPSNNYIEYNDNVNDNNTSGNINNDNNNNYVNFIPSSQSHNLNHFNPLSSITGTVKDNRIHFLGYKPTTWDMKTLSTNSINLLFTQNATQIASFAKPKLSWELIHTISLHLIGPYQFKLMTKKNNIDEMKLSSYPNEMAPLYPFLTHLTQDPLPIKLKCISNTTVIIPCTATPSIITDKTLSFKVEFPFGSDIQPSDIFIESIKMTIPSSIVKIVPVNIIEKGDLTSIITLIAHLDFTTTSMKLTERLYTQSVDFGISYYSNETISNISSSFGHVYDYHNDDNDDDDDDGNNDKGLPMTTIIILSTLLGVSLLIVLLVAFYLLFYRPQSQKNKGGLIVNNEHHIEDSLLELGTTQSQYGTNNTTTHTQPQRVNTRSTRMQNLNDSEVDDVNTFVHGLVKSLDENHPPTYGDLHQDSILDNNQLPEYDIDLEATLNNLVHDKSTQAISSTPSHQGNNNNNNDNKTSDNLTLSHDNLQPLPYESLPQVVSTTPFTEHQ